MFPIGTPFLFLLNSSLKISLTVTNDLVTDQRVHRVATCFHEAGHQVKLIGRVLPESPPVERIYSTLRFKLPFTKGPFFYASYNLKLFFVLLKEKSDVYYANDLDSLPANFLAAKIRRKPIIFDSHEYFPEVPELVNRKVVKQFWLTIERLIVPRLKHCITVSPSIAALFYEKYGVPFKLVRNVPFLRTKEVLLNPPKKSDLGIPAENKVILYQGALNVGRGLELVMEAMTYLKNTTFLVIGAGDIEQDLRKRAQSLELGNRVVFTGRIPSEELPKYTLLADLGFSLEEDLGLNYRFALPNKLFDYIHAEIPVLASNLPDMAALVKKYKVGKIAQDRTPKAIALAFQSMLEDEAQRKVWQTNCSLAQKALNWDTEKLVLLNILDQL